MPRRYTTASLQLLAAIQPVPSLGLPFAIDPNATETQTVGWIDGPSYRDTSSIITSCLITISLCVWSALHLNIPPRGESQLKQWVRTFRWVLMGVFGPELVVWAAWRQYVSARAMQKLRNQRGRGRPSPGPLGKSESAAISETPKNTEAYEIDSGITAATHTTSTAQGWTVVHGFYAAMGGFVFELDAEYAEALCLPESKITRLTLSPHGVDLLAHCGLLPAVAEEEIRDKSKADSIAKSIVCLQVGWTIAQTIARVAYGLPVSLLEVNTIGHIICAIFIYVLWWHKPHLVNEPTTIRGERVQDVAAYMWLSSRISASNLGRAWMPVGRNQQPELFNLIFVPDDRHSLVSEEMPTVSHGSSYPCLGHDAFTVREPNLGSLGIGHSEGQVVDCSGCEIQPSKFQGSTVAMRCRWEAAMRAVRQYEPLRLHLQQSLQCGTRHGSEKVSDVLVQDHAPNWPSGGLMTTFRGVVMGMALWFASIAYGAVHAAAWFDHFPTEVEAWLWRASSLDLMGSGLIWLTINFLGQMSPPVDRYWDRVMAGGASRLSYVVLGFLCTICGLAYGAARIFLVVEALISLRRMPAEAYLVPDWSLLVPHL